MSNWRGALIMLGILTTGLGPVLAQDRDAGEVGAVVLGIWIVFLIYVVRREGR